MKGTVLLFSLLSAVLLVVGRPSNGLKTLHLGSCVVTINLQEIQHGFSEIRDSVQAKDDNINIRILRSTESLQDTKASEKCCLLHHLLSFYLNRVFNNYQTTDHPTLRKLSSLANSFLIIKKDLQLCHAHMTCQCEEEAIAKYNRILSHFEELEPQAATVKALGELDILLRWMEESA
ncbi:PREDICTED: interleukin-20 [Dipodomys ordii]|uniref:Interleukin family protein n=1 Tax=Dipodomys ordii TaxID=10020 RepID=A0A1S3FA89_DIPOR|nr:PREDICTED: interleukin-20 [Dipodomys ordii]